MSPSEIKFRDAIGLAMRQRESFARQSAVIRERRIKKWARAWTLKMIEQANPLWPDLGLCPIWPLPDNKLYPEIWDNALTKALPR